MAKPKETPALVRLEPGMDNIIKAVNNGYNVTVRDVCRAFKCSRSYYDKHIKPYVKHIYVPAKYVAMLVEADVLSSLGCAIYDECAFERMLADGVVTKRTDYVCLTDVISVSAHDELRDLFRRAGIAENIVDHKKRAEVLSALKEELKKLVVENALDEWVDAVNSIDWYLHRSRANWIECDDNGPSTLRELASEWGTAASRKGYGGTDELVHRDIWTHACRRFEITLPDGAKRTFYSKKGMIPPVPDELKDVWEELPRKKRSFYIQKYAIVAVASQKIPKSHPLYYS